MAKKKPYRFVLYGVARAAAAVLCWLPRRVALWLARGAGRLSYGLVGRQRKKILENLRKAYGTQKSESEIRELARKVLGHAAETAMEVLQFPKLTRAKVESFVEMGEAFRLYESLLSEGKGLISITAHLGN